MGNMHMMGSTKSRDMINVQKMVGSNSCSN